MNLSGDGIYDGKIRIQKGQGLTQAIAGELGLNEADCKKLGSVWLEAIELAEQSGAFKDGSVFSRNTVLHEGDEFEFDTNVWNQIVDKVNNKLDKNIKKIGDGAVAEADAEIEPTDEEAMAAVEQLSDTAPYFAAGLTALTLGRAIVSPKYRGKIKDMIAKLSKEQQTAYQKACKEYDKAKADKAKLASKMADDKKLLQAKSNVVKAKSQLDAENKALKENTKYQGINKAILLYQIEDDL